MQLVKSTNGLVLKQRAKRLFGNEQTPNSFFLLLFSKTLDLYLQDGHNPSGLGGGSIFLP